MGSLGVHIFTAISLSGAERADNGLPYTPYSVNMTGRFESLKGIRHPHLCEYIDLVIGDHERVMVVSEAYTTTLSDVIASGVPIPEDQIRHWTVQIVCALHHLNTLGTCHRHLSPESIQLTIPYEMRKTWTDSAEEKSSTHSSLSRTESMGQAARFDDGTDNIGAAQRPGSQDTRQRCCRRECTPDKFIIQPTGATRTRPTTDAEHTNGCQCKPSRHKGPEGTKFSGGDVRLSGYGDFYLTANGAEVAFPFGVPEYMAPELLALEFAKASTDPGSVIPVHTTHPVLSVDPKGRHIPLPGCHSDCDETSAVGNVASDVVVDAGANPKFDVWALGLILLELTLGSYLWQRDRGATADTAARSTGNNNLRSDKDIRNADRRNASEYGTSHHDGKHSNGGDSRKKSSLGEAKGSRYGPASVRADGNQGNASRPVRKSEDLEELLCDILMLAQDVPLDVGGTADEDCVGVGIGGEKSADQDDKSFSVLPGERYSTRSALQKICMSHAALLEERFADCFNRDTGVVNLPMSDEMRDFISLCLRIRPGERPTPGQLLQHPFLNICCMRNESNRHARSNNKSTDNLDFSLTLSNKYHFWKLTGKDVRTELSRREIIAKAPPVTVIPANIHFGQAHGGHVEQRDGKYSEAITILQTADLDARLRRAASDDDGIEVSNEQLDTISEKPGHRQGTKQERRLAAKVFQSHMSDQPLKVRQQDVDYQLKRLRLYEELLLEYPLSRHAIIREACVDIPEILRAEVWAALMGINSTYRSVYETYNKTSKHSADRQIDVDIPRCHQYDRLLSSPDGHAKLRRLLKAFLSANPTLVYWQGMDSIFASWLRLNFNDEALAFSCANTFVEKYLHDYFLPDNSSVMQETLAVYTHLLTFHDPELSSHVLEIGFVPDLYAIPWFLTLYTHVCSFDKIYQIWDSLLVSSSSFPLCFAVAILQQFRSAILSYDFNDCILHFSDMPALDVEWCLATSRQIWAQTPPSVTSRKHDAWEACEENAKKQLQKDIDSHVADTTVEGNVVKGLLLDSDLEWWAKTPPLAELRSNRVAQIRFDDVMLMDQYLMVDIRSDASFHAIGHWRASLHFDAESLANMSDVLLPFKGGNIVVMTEMDAEDGDSFSWELVKRGYARVAVLRGGMDCVRGATEEYTVNAIYESNGARSPITSSTRSTQSHSRTLSPSELLQTSAANALRTSNSTTDSTGANASTSAQAHGRGTIQRSSSGVQHTYRTSGQGGWDEKGVGSRRPRRPGRVMCSCYAPLTNAVTSVRGAMLRQCEYYK